MKNLRKTWSELEADAAHRKHSIALFWIGLAFACFCAAFYVAMIYSAN